MKKMLLLLVAGLGLFVGCAKEKAKNHAPVCAYGQVLSYQDGVGYTCKIALNGTGGYGGGQQYQSQYYYGGLQAVYAPITICPSIDGSTPDLNQTILQWNNTWVCMYNDILRPSNADSPVGYFPVGRGGEFCNSSTGQYNPQQPQVPQPPQYPGSQTMMISCAPGFYCQMGGQFPGQQPQPMPMPGQQPQGGIYGGSCQRAYF